MMDEQIFFSQQVKQSVITSNNHGKYELPHEFLNNICRILGNKEISGKSKYLIEL